MERRGRSEEHTSELQSHSEISYAVFCLKKKKNSNRRRRPGNLSRAACNGLTPLRALLCGHRSRQAPRIVYRSLVFFFNDTATTEIYTNLNTLSLHDALPI